MDRIERKDRILKYQGSILNIYDDVMLLPDGSEGHWDYVEHRNGAAAALPVLPDGRLVLVRQYRNALEREVLEIPAGAKTDPSESSAACAAREMEEEIGYHAGKLEKLLTTATTGAFCNECIDVYLAMDLQKTVQHLDEEEILNVECWELEDLCQMIFSGELIDAKTIAAILAYKVYKNKRVGI